MGIQSIMVQWQSFVVVQCFTLTVCVFVTWALTYKVHRLMPFSEMLLRSCVFVSKGKAWSWRSQQELLFLCVTGGAPTVCVCVHLCMCVCQCVCTCVCVCIFVCVHYPIDGWWWRTILSSICGQRMAKWERSFCMTRASTSILAPRTQVSDMEFPSRTSF